jgi:hypothetical protein
VRLLRFVYGIYLRALFALLLPLLTDGGFIFSHEAGHREIAGLFFDDA